jgi:hypothetical protein
MEVMEFRCTRNTPYIHDCLGRDNWSARQGYYIKAHDRDEALAKMAERFPEDTEGFTATKWQGFDVTVVEVER